MNPKVLERLNKYKHDIMAMSIENLSSKGTCQQFYLNYAFGNLLSLLNQPVKAKDDNHQLFLVRFQEGTRIHSNFLKGITAIRWMSSPFIPVIGLELSVEESYSILEKIKIVDGYLKSQQTQLFHPYSFLEI
ncbi:hypothetical protein ACFVS2_25700 [Brevibacillus sp. NPDC058079]|uniref:hypothetical protein n=1 Tax=Brevibacillus sp. NPDC058079 TaxID=3346330 RepID=UPI0036E3E505